MPNGLPTYEVPSGAITVEALIEKLRELPPDALVCHEGSQWHHFTTGVETRPAREAVDGFGLERVVVLRSADGDYWRRRTRSYRAPHR